MRLPARKLLDRLSSAAAALPSATLPEIHRGSLVPLVLTAAAWGKRVESLPLLDAPKPYALEAARSDLRAWGALEGELTLSACGQDLFALPIDDQHARLLVEARQQGCLDDMIDLVAVLSRRVRRGSACAERQACQRRRPPPARSAPSSATRWCGLRLRRGERGLAQPAAAHVAR